uniref:Dynein axonemal assembly factor 1 homolog n=1 Tax=Drosophila rhopaloa TaxID=1041015 RepID=A0A6P4F9S3_DRORH
MSQGTARKEITGLNRMTQKGLKDLCKRDKLYQTPRLNDVLYLHYQGYQSIECLEEYTELKCLWLECNAISEIQGLEKLTKLKCLFLQNNLITTIENLEPCRELDTLNLSSNHIRKIQNIGTDILPVLNTLNISSNYLKDCESLSDLVQCKTLSVLDLSNNRIDDILIVKVFEQMPSLKVLVLQGNPVVSRLPQYRKTLILACKELTYLDSRPVFPRDRACAEAWKQDGYEGERKENNRWNRAERRKTRESVNCTIRMRNRHRPPDQQDPLLKSSDSEDDTTAEKTRKKVELENGGVDDLWDEVSGEQPSSEHSTTSSSSADDNGGAGSQDDDIAENISNRNRRPPEGRPKCLYEPDLDNVEEIEEKVKEGNPESTKSNGSEDANKNELVDSKEKGNFVRVPIEEAKLEELNIRKENREDDDKTDSIEDSKIDNPEETAEIEVKLFKVTDTQNTEEDISIKPNEVHTVQCDSSSELDNTEDLEHTCKTLTIVSQNNELGVDPTSKEIKEKLIDEMYKSFGDEIYDELNEPLEMILSAGTTNYRPEDILCCEENKTPRDFYQNDEDPCFTPKTKEQLEFEQDCAIANDKCAHDLEEMGSQLEEDLAELRQSTEHLVGPLNNETEQTDSEADEEVLTTQQDPKSPIITQQFEERRKQMLLRQEAKAKERESLRKDTSNTDTILQETVEDDEQDQLFAKILDDATDNVPKRIFGSGCDAPSQGWSQEECMRQLTLSEVTEILKEEDVFTKPITKNTSAEEAEEICIRMDQKLAADEQALRKLLQDLEDEADVAYDIETKVEYEEEIITTPETDVVGICTSLLDDIIFELTFNEILRAQKPKSFEFGPIESDEEFSYSTEPKLEKLVPPELEDPARGKSLRECLDVFSDFVTSMADPKLPCMLGRNPTSGVEKIRAAQELLKSKNLAELNKDTAESLDAQIAKEAERVKRRVAASATRCFDQREKYEDTLEVVENRLMVVKKDSGELEELPPPPALISDTESEDYDTAEEDYTPGKGDIRRPWTTPYKPKPRRSEEHLVTEAMQQCRVESASQGFPDEGKENDPVEDEFYSLEAMTTFGNLDSEFFQKLNLEKVTGSDDAESAIECMRSYNELKACMKTGSTEHQLTREENEMLQEMLSKEESEVSKSKQSNPQLDEENDLLKKMVQRMKEFEERERQLQLVPEELPKELDPINLSQGGSKLFEISEAEIVSSEIIADRNMETGVEEGKTKVDQENSSRIKESVHPLVKDQESPKNVSIDDDIQSDPSTDYESGEEIVVVEPPKLPEAVLKSFFSEGFEAELKMVNELEEATRRNLYSLQAKQLLRSTTNDGSLPEKNVQENQKDKKPNSEQSAAAKAKWAKIADRLHEFLDPETIAMLDKQEFAESDECEDEEDENFLSELKCASGDSALIGKKDDDNIDQNIGDGNPCPSKVKENIYMENQDQNLGSNQGEGDHIGTTSAQDTIMEKSTEFEDNSIEGTDKPNENEKQPQEVPTTKPFTIDYFEATEPNESETFGDSETYKTEQIQCNLEILNDDGDVVVKEVKVSAQVTFK